MRFRLAIALVLYLGGCTSSPGGSSSSGTTRAGSISGSSSGTSSAGGSTGTGTGGSGIFSSDAGFLSGFAEVIGPDGGADFGLPGADLLVFAELADNPIPTTCGAWSSIEADGGLSVGGSISGISLSIYSSAPGGQLSEVAYPAFDGDTQLQPPPAFVVLNYTAPDAGTAVAILGSLTISQLQPSLGGYYDVTAAWYDDSGGIDAGAIQLTGAFSLPLCPKVVP